jgi:transposase
VFEDEVGFSFLEAVGTTWAPCGRPPVLRRVSSRRRELSTLVGLTLAGKVYKRHFGRAIKAEDVMVGLAHLQRHIRGQFILIWDRSPTHKAKKVKAYLATHPEIMVEWLPAYAPELNPEEYCHGNVKKRLKNLTPREVLELRKKVDTGFARIRQRRDLILGFFHHAGLVVKELW